MFFVSFFRVKSFAAKNHGQERCSIWSNICCFWLNNQSLYIIICKSAKKKNWWSVMFMRVVAPLNIAKSQGFSIILNWSIILDIMYGKIIPLPLYTQIKEGEMARFGFCAASSLIWGGGISWGGDSVQDCSLLRCGVRVRKGGKREK